MNQEAHSEQELREALASETVRAMLGDDEHIIKIFLDLKRSNPGLRFMNWVTTVPQSSSYVAPPGQEYVDPYLFETGYFTSREEYEELSRTAKIRPRAKA